jgi:molybdopterin synthase catalytic subunit
MKVRVRLFAQLRERAGKGEVEIELPEGAVVRDAIAAMGELVAGLPVVMAVNREYADESMSLSPGDELALIPPVSGGSSVHVAVRHGDLSMDDLCRFVRDPRAGAVVTFSGVTRDVPRLEYEAYEEMALSSMREIAEAAVERHGLCAAAVEHRVGAVPLSEASILIAVSAPHRAEAFAGGREIIDEVKARAPIFKQEEGRWVEGTRPV